MTETTDAARSGVKSKEFASRRTLVLRRFARNRAAMASLVILAVMFIGCYALPPLLPWSYTDLDFYSLQDPPSTDHWFGTNALGQDLFAQILRGMQKSMLIGVCVAVISTGIAATVGSIAGYFGGWRDRTLMWLVDLLLVVPSFILIAILTPPITKKLGQRHPVDRAARRVQLDGEFPHGARTDNEPAGARIRPGRTVYGGVSSRRIITRHIIPNVASILIIDAALNVAVAILAETGLSFLGFGIQPPDISLGTLIATAPNRRRRSRGCSCFPPACWC